MTVNKATLATPSEPGALKAGSRSKTGFTVTWDGSDECDGLHGDGHAERWDCGDRHGECAEHRPGGSAFTGLTAGTTYTVSVVATGNTANYEASTAATLSQATAANVAPSIVDITNKTATFGTNLLVDVDATDTNPEDTLR